MIRTWRNAGKRSGRAGFTLQEALVTVSLLGVGLALGLANFDWWTWRLDTAVTEVAQRISVARSTAVMRQHDVVVEFDPARRSLAVHEDTDNDGERDDGERVRTYVLEEGISFATAGAPTYLDYTPAPITFEDGRVVFRRNGSASAEGAVYIGRPGTTDRKARVVLVVRATGYTQSLRYSGSGWVAHE